MLVETKQIINGEEVRLVIDVDDATFPIENPYGDVRDAKNLRKPLALANDIFGDAMNLAKNCATSAISSIKKFDKAIAPNIFELQVAIKIDAEFGAVLTKIGGDAQLQISMTWKHGGEDKNG